MKSENQDTPDTWRYACPTLGCGSHTFYFRKGQLSFNDTGSHKPFSRKPRQRGYVCRKCKTVFQVPKDTKEVN